MQEQRIVSERAGSRLVVAPQQPGKAVKALRPNRFAGYELRLGDLRILHNVDEANMEVVIVAVGRKVGNLLIVEGKEFHGHETDSAE